MKFSIANYLPGFLLSEMNSWDMWFPNSIKCSFSAFLKLNIWVKTCGSASTSSMSLFSYSWSLRISWLTTFLTMRLCSDFLISFILFEHVFEMPLALDLLTWSWSRDINSFSFSLSFWFPSLLTLYFLDAVICRENVGVFWWFRPDDRRSLTSELYDFRTEGG